MIASEDNCERDPMGFADLAHPSSGEEARASLHFPPSVAIVRRHVTGERTHGADGADGTMDGNRDQGDDGGPDGGKGQPFRGASLERLRWLDGPFASNNGRR